MLYTHGQKHAFVRFDVQGARREFYRSKRSTSAALSHFTCINCMFSSPVGFGQIVAPPAAPAAPAALSHFTCINCMFCPPVGGCAFAKTRVLPFDVQGARREFYRSKRSRASKNSRKNYSKIKKCSQKPSI